jgi:NADPH-dependent 2,4-dienoyl-CoA reductase/sulfur reductase-like enzyme
MRAVIIGTGPAGITAAETLRRQDPTGSVVALSTEPYPPYSPAAMADHFLTGRDQTLYWKGREVAELRGIDERREAVVIAVEVSWSRASALATWSGTRS